MTNIESHRANIINTITLLMLVFLPSSMVANYLNGRMEFAVLFLFMFVATLIHRRCFKRDGDIAAASEQMLIIHFGLSFAFFLIGEQQSFDVMWLLSIPIVAVMSATLERLKVWLLRCLLLMVVMILGVYLFPEFVKYDSFALFSLLWALVFISYLAYSYKLKQLHLEQEIASHQNSLEAKIAEGLKEITQLNKNLDETQSEILEKLATLSQYRSNERATHSNRIGKYAKTLALLAGVDEESTNILERSAPLHDIGHIGIEDAILNKPGRLTSEEFEKMKRHVHIGHSILDGSNKPLIQTAARIALEHHERYDGSGYPRGLKGEEISLGARIVAILDVFDALYGESVYKKNWSNEKIINYFEEERGKHFDPRLAELFLKNIELFINIYEEAYLESNMLDSRAL